MAHIASDFEYVAFTAHQQLLTELAATDVGGVNLDAHDLLIGNDIFVGGEGADHITGDHAVILTPIVDGQRFDLIVLETAPLDSAEQAAAIELLTQNLASHNASLSEHIATNHATDLSLTEAQQANLPPDYEFDVTIGNDTIEDQRRRRFGRWRLWRIFIPILLTTPQTVIEQVDVELNVKILAADSARWLERRHHEFDFEELALGYTHESIRNERGQRAKPPCGLVST